MGDQFSNASSFDVREVELHVSCIFLEIVQKTLIRRAEDIVDLMHLVNLIIARKQGEERNDLKKNTANTPKVHFVTVVSIS